MVEDAVTNLAQNPEQLFGHAHREGDSTIDLLQTTKEAKIHGPMLAAMAKQDLAVSHPRRTLQASSDRSIHSQGMVEHLEGKMGAQFSAREMDNLMDFLPQMPAYPRESVETDPLSEPVKTSRVRSAQKEVRDVMRPPIQGPKKPGHEVHKLPGMERF